MPRLVLTRREATGVTIRIPASENDTVIHVEYVERYGGNARIAFDAPRTVEILRDEIVPPHRRIAR